ncbi:MAG: tRNA pseudouridine(55) synthase TruB [Saprospiraceae bacterium]|nr:tRNA pseudouridine(55) synthase TruB [Saprospiraceae bacterium]
MLLLDKPYEWTSFNLVKKVKYTVKAKVGHAGTLDPLATGLMILCTGKFTKKLTELTGLPKSYSGAFKIGNTTPSYDRETEEENSLPYHHITEDLIRQTADSFLGQQAQIPPMFSAIKKDGKKLYELARKGQEIQREARNIEITTFDITAIDLPFIHFKISCSKGTYIRSIAHDFGQQLGVGAYLHDLRRIQIGDFSIEDAWTVEDFVHHVKAHREGHTPA